MSVRRCLERRSEDYGKCRHVMHERCPGCRREVYAPAVWGFSHGEFPCDCGYGVVPANRAVAAGLRDLRRTP